MRDNLYLGAVVLFFTIFFTFMYGQFPADEHSSWLKELIWWGMTLSWLSLLVLAGIVGYKYWQKLLAMIDSIKDERKQAQNEEVKRQVKRFDALIKSLGEAEIVSKETVQSTVLQAKALADVIIILHKRSLSFEQQAAAYEQAFEALEENDQIKIARAAGRLEPDLRTLMTTPAADESFYRQVALSISERQTNAREWLVEYQNLRNDLMATLTGIMVRLAQVRAHGEAAHAAQPLMLAEKNLTRAYDTLKLGVSEKPTLQIEGLTYQYLQPSDHQALTCDP